MTPENRSAPGLQVPARGFTANLVNNNGDFFVAYFSGFFKTADAVLNFEIGVHATSLHPL